MTDGIFGYASVRSLYCFLKGMVWICGLWDRGICVILVCIYVCTALGIKCLHAKKIERIVSTLQRDNNLTMRSIPVQLSSNIQ